MLLDTQPGSVSQCFMLEFMTIVEKALYEETLAQSKVSICTSNRPHIFYSSPGEPEAPQHHNHAALCWMHLTESEQETNGEQR